MLSGVHTHLKPTSQLRIGSAKQQAAAKQVLATAERTNPGPFVEHGLHTSSLLTLWTRRYPVYVAMSPQELLTTRDYKPPSLCVSFQIYFRNMGLEPRGPWDGCQREQRLNNRGDAAEAIHAASQGCFGPPISLHPTQTRASRQPLHMR